MRYRVQCDAAEQAIQVSITYQCVMRHAMAWYAIIGYAVAWHVMAPGDVVRTMREHSLAEHSLYHSMPYVGAI